MRVSLITLGCKTNQFESQAMEKLFAAAGDEIVPFEEECDVCIINTCTVTSTGDSKSRSAIRRARAMHPGAVIAVCGCLAELSGEELARSCGADLVGGNRDHIAFIDSVRKAVALKTAAPLVVKSESDGFVRLPAGGAHDRTRALLKVEDGCVNFCSYCIIPYARGKVRSLPYAQAVEDAARLQKAGYREIVITGIEISSYGRDLPGGEDLATLVCGVCEAAPEARIGLGSLKPTAVTDGFCRRLSAQKNLCRHFHLSLQSGCDKTLARMNRKYVVSDIRAAVDRIREYFPDANITADVIVGFPGESAEDFARTLEFLDGIDLGDIHFFPYSRRKVTPAAEMEGQVPKAEKKRRCNEAARLKAKCKRRTYKKYVGTIQNVLLESDGYGYTNNYLYTRVEGWESLESGKLYSVKIAGYTDKHLIARLD